MFEQLTQRFNYEKNKLIDDCTKNLVNHAGFNISKNANNFDILMLMDDMKKKGYKIEYKIGYDSKDRLYLMKIGDLTEDIEAGYEIDIKAEDLKVSIIAIPIGNVKSIKL